MGPGLRRFSKAHLIHLIGNKIKLMGTLGGGANPVREFRSHQNGAARGSGFGFKIA
jgi:hypothetical protein